MDIDFTRDNYRFNARTSALIYNNDLTKVLLFNVEERDFYLLPGGRIEQLEDSKSTIKREIKEEIGWDNIDYSFLLLSEEIVNDKGIDLQQLHIIYKGVYKEDIKELKFKGLEGDWINFEWVNVNEIDKYKLYPEELKNVIKGTNTSNHIITDLINK